MAGTRKGVPGRARGGHCGPLDDRHVRRLLGDNPTSGDKPLIITSLTVAQDAIKDLKTINNLGRRTRTAAKQIATYWGDANIYAAKGHSEEDLVGMMRSISRTGSLILAVGAVFAPDQDLGSFSPVRQEGMKVAEELLIGACGDNLDLFRSLEEPVPDGLRLSRASKDSWAYLSGRSTPEPLGCRLPSYDYDTVNAYAVSRGRYVLGMDGVVSTVDTTSVKPYEDKPAQIFRGYMF